MIRMNERAITELQILRMSFITATLTPTGNNMQMIKYCVHYKWFYDTPTMLYDIYETIYTNNQKIIHTNKTRA